MTTITSDSIPTTGSSDRSAGSTTSRTWRYVATFAAGVAVSIAVAAGIGVRAADDDSPSTPAPAGSAVSQGNTDPNICPMYAGKPC